MKKTTHNIYNNMLCVVFLLSPYLFYSQISEKARLFNLNYNYAYYHYQFKNYDSALIYLNKAEKIAPLLELGLVLKAKVFSKLNRENDCAKYLAKYCISDPSTMFITGFQDSVFLHYVNSSKKCKKIMDNVKYYKKLYYQNIDLNLLEEVTDLYYADQLCRYPNSLNLNDPFQKKIFYNQINYSDSINALTLIGLIKKYGIGNICQNLKVNRQYIRLFYRHIIDLDTLDSKTSQESKFLLESLVEAINCYQMDSYMYATCYDSKYCYGPVYCYSYYGAVLNDIGDGKSEYNDFKEIETVDKRRLQIGLLPIYLDAKKNNANLPAGYSIKNDINFKR